MLGINTARSLTFKDGRINQDQVAFIRDTFARTPRRPFRVLVTHHPLFALPVGEEITRAIGRQELALDAIQEAGVDMLLAGHNHHASTHNASDLVTRAGRRARGSGGNRDLDPAARSGAELQHHRRRRCLGDDHRQRVEERRVRGRSMRNAMRGSKDAGGIAPAAEPAH